MSSFLRLISHCMMVPHFLKFIHWWTSGLFPPFGYYEWHCINIHKYVLGWIWHMFSFLLGIYLTVEFLCHMIIPCLTFEELPNFYKVTIFTLHFTFPPGNFPLLHQHLVSSLLFIIIVVVMLLGEKWCLIVLICVSLCLLN